MTKLDKKDMKILANLVSNCRIYNASLAKKVGLSREVVAYRLRNLEKEKIISGYTIEIGFNKLGFMAYSIGIKLQTYSKEKLSRIISFLKENKKVVFLEAVMSKYDIVCTILVKSVIELDKETKLLREVIGTDIKYLDIDVFIGDYDFYASFFSLGTCAGEINFLDYESFKLDKEDESLLVELVKDSRATAVDLSEATGLSVFSIADRIRKMVKKRVILSFRAMIDTEKLGFHRYTLILNAVGGKIEPKLVEFCRFHKSIWDVGRFVGNYNYAVEIFAKDNDEFKKVVESILFEFSDSIIDYEALIITEELKHSYFFV